MSDNRMPVIQGGELVDVVNNVIYNWGTKGAHGNPRKANLINNVMRAGPETTTFEVWTPQTHPANPSLYRQSVYHAGNVADGFAFALGEPSTVYAAQPFPLSIAPEPAAAAYERVLREVGANLPVRDSVDQRIVNNVVHRTGEFLNGENKPAPTPVWP
jgi:hypothetical protein